MQTTKTVKGSILSQSFKELKKASSITGAGLLAAMNILVDRFFAIEIIPKTLELGFTYIPVAVSAYLYGPIVTGGIGAFLDIIKFALRPSGPFFPGFTINEFVIGFLMGLFLYKKKITWGRVALARASVVLSVNLFLTPLWLHILYGKAMYVYVSTRIIKNLVCLPIEIALCYFVLKKVEDIRGRQNRAG